MAPAVVAQAASIATKRGRGSRTNNNRPPPGAVNLERSYEICRAVIQNSPNRHQLKAQLRPPPSMLASVTNSTQPTNTTVVPNPSITKVVTKKVTDDSIIPNRVMFKVSIDVSIAL